MSRGKRQGESYAGLRRRGRRVWLRHEQGVDHGAFIGRELCGEGGGVDGLLALLRGHVAKIEDGAADETLAGNGKRFQLLDRSTPLLTLRG